MTDAVLHRDTLIPRPPRGMGPGLLLALLVHGALILAIAYGVRWHASEPEGIEAELWAAVPQMAAPPPAVQPPPAPQHAPKPPPPAPARAQPEPDAQIAIEKARREEAERRKKDEAEKKLAEKRKKEEAEKLKQEQAERLAEKRKQEQQEEKRRLEREEQQRAELRRKNLERMMAQAGNGEASSTGSAERTAGPSAGYAGRIKARIKPNIVFTDTPSGNPIAEVEVRLAPDGTIVGQRLTKSSGLPEWDEAVQRAIERTQVLPRDIDGRVPATMVIAFRPHD